VASSRSFDHEKKNLSVLFILFFSFSLSTPGWEEAAVDPGSNSVAPLIFIFLSFSYAREQIVIFHHHHQLAGSLISFFSESLHCRSRSPDQRNLLLPIK
jgi:hypothetical protein